MKKLKILYLLSLLISNTAFSTTLSESLVSAYQNNPELIAAREQLKMQDEQIFEAIAGFLPQIGYEAIKRYSKTDTASSTTAQQEGNTTKYVTQTTKTAPWTHSKSKQSSLNIQQNIFKGGQSLMAIQIAKYNIESGRAQLLSTEQKIFVQTIQAYLSVIQTKEVIEVNKQNVKFYEQKYESVVQEVEAGIKKRSDLATAKASKSNAQTLLAKATGEYDTALATYNKVVGIPADNLTEDKFLSSLPANQLEFLQKSLKDNPDLLNVLYQQKSADIAVLSNAAIMLPTVNIGGTLDRSWAKTTGLSTTTNPPTSNSKTVYVSVNVPIYQGGMEYSGIRKANAQAASLKYYVKNAKATVTQNTTQAWSAYIVNQESVKTANEAVNAAQIAVDGTQEEYREGVNTLSNLITAQENLYHYQLSLINAEQELELSKYNIISIMGRLNAKDLALPTKIYSVTKNYNKIKMKLIGL
ncbi:MAG: TolC family outer membrane protein [Pseudomonadota bacterium]